MTTRRLAAILAADVVGFSSMMEKDEEGTLAKVKALQREVIEPRVKERGGRLVKTTGDGFLCEFGSPVEAVRCAIDVQEATRANGASDLLLRMGINLGDIIIEPDGDIYGEGVNVAARLEQLAEPGGLCISGSVHEHAQGKIGVQFESRGEQQVRNIARPVRVFALAGAPQSRSEAKPLPLPVKPSIAVLPFTNMSGDPEQEYFADGMAEDIITALSRVRWLFVIARNSSFTYKGRAVDVKQVGRELGVRYVLEGSVRRVGNRVRITGQLIEAATGAHLWADRFDGELSAIFELQDDVTQQVVGAIEPSLRYAEIERTHGKAVENLDAYDLYLRGLFELSHFGRARYERAADLFRQVIHLDPHYSDGYAALADCIGRSFAMGWITDLGWTTTEVLTAARAAITADPENPTALAVAAWAFAYFGGHFDEAVELAARAVRLHPNSAYVRTQAGFVYAWSGESDIAVQHLEVARRLNPVDPRAFLTFLALGAAHFFGRNFDAAERAARRAIAHMPSNTVARRILATSLAHLGRLDEARDVVKELLELQPNSTLSFSRRSPRYRHTWMTDLFVKG